MRAYHLVAVDDCLLTDQGQVDLGLGQDRLRLLRIAGGPAYHNNPEGRCELGGVARIIAGELMFHLARALGQPKEGDRLGLVPVGWGDGEVDKVEMIPTACIGNDSAAKAFAQALLAVFAARIHDGIIPACRQKILPC